jgi:methionyl-tRNA formyltransferase
VRIAFLGSPEFAVPSLRALAESPQLDVSLVITQPDRPAGRGRRFAAPPVKLAAQALDLPVLQPQSMRATGALDALRAAPPDLLVVVAYGEFLRRAVLEAAPHGALNVHPSLLPRYRGAAPIPAAILHGDVQTGVSIIKLVRRMDAGPIVAQQEMDITSSDTTASLSARLAQQAALLLPDICAAWVAGAVTAREQDESAATYTHEWTKDDARIDWHAPADAIERLTRAAQPWPVAWTIADGERLQLLRAALDPAFADDVLPPGTVRLVDGRVFIQTGSARLELVEVQPAGKRAMSAGDWWRGRRGVPLTLE